MYATREQAVAYVRDILDQAPALPAAPVYLICGPDVRQGKTWPGMVADLAQLLPGATFAAWADPTAQPAHGLDGPARGACLAAVHRGAVVIPKAQDDRLLIGPAALREAEAFIANGRAVLVYSPGRLAAWPDCRNRPAKKLAGRWYRHEVELPAEPGRPLPTLAASVRVLVGPL